MGMTLPRRPHYSARQGLCVQILHDQEVDPVLVADVVERANVRVVQAGDGLRLALEPLFQIRVRGDVLGEDLDGDGAIEAGVTVSSSSALVMWAEHYLLRPDSFENAKNVIRANADNDRERAAASSHRGRSPGVPTVVWGFLRITLPTRVRWQIEIRAWYAHCTLLNLSRENRSKT